MHLSFVDLSVGTSAMYMGGVDMDEREDAAVRRNPNPKKTLATTT